MSGVAVTFDKNKVNNYLKICQNIDKLLIQKEAIEADMKAYVEETGEVTICNLLKVSISKNPPKLVSNTEGGKVTDSMRMDLCKLLDNTEFVKHSVGIEIKKIHEQKDTNKTLKAALKKVGISTDQSEKMLFDRIVKSAKK